MMVLIYIFVALLLLALNFSKKKDFFKYGIFSRNGYRNLKKTILTYGYNYDIKTHLFSTFFFLCILYFLCYQFEVRLETYLLLALVSLFMLPHIIIWLLFHSYQEKVFNGFTMFLQTFIAVFKLNPKTYPSLCECEKVCEGEVGVLISNMKEVLMKEGNIEASLKLLSDYQPHFIVHNLITLVATIERHGGSFSEGLDLIQDDIDDWIEDIYEFKKKQVSTKNKMMGLCLLSIGIAFLSKNMLAEISFDTRSDIYQLAILIFLSCLLFTLFMAHRIFSKSWFEKEEAL
ncbi:hypothetical protein [uncultured Traorella sp.]|uniref:hypothetical protein n=1 Tax=uncultured Traorella sp. TaxID=1929048 RepID=UPI0025DF2CDC|nr:hypothetical protein [uncultured Traorella sp.]